MGASDRTPECGICYTLTGVYKHVPKVENQAPSKQPFSPLVDYQRREDIFLLSV